MSLTLQPQSTEVEIGMLYLIQIINDKLLLSTQVGIRVLYITQGNI